LDEKRIGRLIGSVHALSGIYRGFEPRSCHHTTEYRYLLLLH